MINPMTPPLSIMASGGPVMNGDISRSPSQAGTLEETLQQMNILIQENRDLKGERTTYQGAGEAQCGVRVVVDVFRGVV